MRPGVRAQLLGTSAVTLGLFALVGGVALTSMSSIDAGGARMYNESVQKISYASAVLVAIEDDSRLTVTGVEQIGSDSAQAAVANGLMEDDNTVTSSLEALSGLSGPDDQALLAEIRSQYQAYLPLRDTIRVNSLSGVRNAAESELASATVLSNKVQASASRLLQRQKDQARSLKAANADTTSRANLIVIGAFALALLASLALSLLVARRITRGVKAVQGQMSAMRGAVGDLGACFVRLAHNDLTAAYDTTVERLDFRSSDEIGSTVAVSNELVGDLNSMGQSYETARRNMVDVLGQVRSASDNVARTSLELTGASSTSGQATSQIATAINHVAAGAQEQARAATQTAAAVEELGAVIDQVRAGAANTQSAVQEASGAVGVLASAIQTAGKASAEVLAVSTRAAAVAADGYDGIEEAVAAMSRISLATDASADKVSALGSRSDRIRQVAETVDELARETDELARTVAAGAGQAGDGAPEAAAAGSLRGLADRAGQAARDVASLVEDVQRATDEAIESMRAGTAEVQSGAALTESAGESLQAIAKTVTATQSAIERITGSVNAMTDSSAGVVRATSSIARIADQTSTAAETMTANAALVAGSVDSIAAISEENSAASEEVSAATEELAAQIEEVAASAAELSAMAGDLATLVGRFTLSAEASGADASATGAAGKRRRSVAAPALEPAPLPA